MSLFGEVSPREDSVPYKDVEKRRAYGRDWIKQNPEKARDAMRRWRRAHPDEHAAEGRLFYSRHLEEKRAYGRTYTRTHRQIRSAAANRYRARKLAADGSYTAHEWLELVASYQGRCAYCGSAGPLHADHRVPLKRGGANDISNIVPACPACNSRKGVLTEVQFRARLAAEAARLAPPEAG